MPCFKNTAYTKRNYECSNIVACVANERPAEHFSMQMDDSILEGLTHLYTQNDVKYYGHL